VGIARNGAGEAAQSKLKLRSVAIVEIRGSIRYAREKYAEVRALEARRDQALYDTLYECSHGMAQAYENPEAFAQICDETGNVRGREIETRFIDLISRTDEGVSTLSDERRAEYGAAAMWFGEPTLSGERTDTADDDDKAIALARENGGIEGIAEIYRKFRDKKNGKIEGERVYVAQMVSDDQSEGANLFSTYEAARQFVEEYLGGRHERWHIVHDYIKNFDLTGCRLVDEKWTDGDDGSPYPMRVDLELAVGELIYIDHDDPDEILADASQWEGRARKGRWDHLAHAAYQSSAKTRTHWRPKRKQRRFVRERVSGATISIRTPNWPADSSHTFDRPDGCSIRAAGVALFTMH
jgi:hypothetical protein